MVHRISPEEASYKLAKVTRQQLGKAGVPYIATHDGRTIRYPDPDIRVRPLLQTSQRPGSRPKYLAVSVTQALAYEHPTVDSVVGLSLGSC